MGQAGSKRAFSAPLASYGNDNGALMYIKRSFDGNARMARSPMVWMSNGNGEEIPAVLVESDWGRKDKYTLIYAHSETEDLGIAASGMSEVADFLGVDIFCFEFSGYGLASGNASEKNCYADIRAAYEYLVRDRGIAPESIVLFGRGLGTALCVDLASKARVGGVVLVSSFLSLPSTLGHLKGRGHAFNNMSKIRSVHCQVMLVHGMNDERVPYGTAMSLYKKAPNSVAPVIVPFADRENIMNNYLYEVLPFVERFLDKLAVPAYRRTMEFEKLLGRREQSLLNERSAKRKSVDLNRTMIYSTPVTDREGRDALHLNATSSDFRSTEARDQTHDPAASLNTTNPSMYSSHHNFRGGSTTKRGSLDKAFHMDKDSSNRVKTFWKLLSLESDDENGPFSTTESYVPSVRLNPSDEAIKSERTREMVEILSNYFRGHLSRDFLLQCLRASRFDMEEAQAIGKRYRRMMKLIGLHPKRPILIEEVEDEIRRGTLLAPDSLDSEDRPVMFITPKHVEPVVSNWVPTLKALLYMLSYMHENDEAQIRGISLFLDLRDCSWSSRYRDFWKRLFRAVLVYYPCRVMKMYLLDSGRFVPSSMTVMRMVRPQIGWKNIVEVKPSNIVQHVRKTELLVSLGGLKDPEIESFIESRQEENE